MARILKILSLALLPALLAACSGDEADSVISVPTATATVLPSSTSTATSVPTSTATSAPTSTATPTSPPTVTSTTRPVGAKALFSLDALNPGNPFPTDRLLDETGHVHVTGALIGADLPPDAKYDTARGLANIVSEQLEQLTGFSTFAPIRIKFEREVALPPEGKGVFLTDCEHDELIPTRYVATNPDTSGDTALEIYPLKPLRPKTSYSYFVTQDLLDAEGKPVFPTADFLQALLGHDAELDEWRAKTLCGLEVVKLTHFVLTSDLVIADNFTTQPTTDDLLAIKDRFVQGELPAPSPVFEDSPIAGLVTGIFDEGSPEFEAIVGSPTSPTIAKVAVGSFPSFDFRKDASGFDPEFVYGEGVPPKVDLDFYMTIPKAPMPEGGYPIAIFGHGLGGNSQNVVSAATLWGDAPIVGIGISAVQHGRRGNVSMFFNLVDGFATREHFRQTVADTVQLQFMIRETSTPPFDKIDKARIEYFGISLGGIMGTLFMGVAPDVRVGVLSVPGGGLPNIIQSEAIGALLKPLISLTVGIPQTDPKFPAFFHRFTQLSQWVIDAGDPINTAPHILENPLPGVPAKRILMQEGIFDSVVPNQTTDDLALAMGIPNAKATLGCESETGCSGIWRYVMTEYGQPENSGHGVTGLVAEAAKQVEQFLITDGTVITDGSPE